MKLNLSIIRDNLREYPNIQCYGNMRRVLHLDRPVFLVPEIKMESNKLYVAHAEDLPVVPEQEGICVVCTDGKVPPNWLNGNTSLLVVKGVVNSAILFQKIQEIYDFFDKWELSLFKELGKDIDFDIKQIIKMGVQVLKNPFSMMDSSMRVIFSSNVENTEAGILVQVSDQPMSLELISILPIKEACHQERTIRVPYLSAVNVAGARCYCYNLYPMGHFAGCAWIYDLYQQFRDSDFALADYFFSIFQQAFQKSLRNYTDAESPKVAAIRKLLKHTPISTQEHELFLLEPDSHWRCFKLQEKDLQKSMPKDYMYATLRALLPGTVYATFLKGSIVGLIRMHDNKDNIDTFEDILHRMDYFCGLSNPFTNILKFNDYYHQAEFTVEYSAQVKEENILYFQDCLLQYMLQHCTGNLSSSNLESRGIQILKDYDQRKGTEYLKTLDSYLKNECSISRTSEKLYIHRSSLLKRLDKIERITGIDLENSDTKLYLRIYFKLSKNC